MPVINLYWQRVSLISAVLQVLDQDKIPMCLNQTYRDLYSFGRVLFAVSIMCIPAKKKFTIYDS